MREELGEGAMEEDFFNRKERKERREWKILVGLSRRREPHVMRGAGWGDGWGDGWGETSFSAHKLSQNVCISGI